MSQSFHCKHVRHWQQVLTKMDRPSRRVFSNISKLDLHKVPWILNDFDMCYLYKTFGQEFVSAIEGVDGLPWIEAQFQTSCHSPEVLNIPEVWSAVSSRKECL